MQDRVIKIILSYVILILCVGIIVNLFNTETEKDNTKSNTTSESEELSFSNKEVEEALENYLELAGKLQGAPMNVVEELDLCEDGEYINAKITNDNYIITKIKYDAFKNKMLKYVTEELFEKEFGEKYFKEEDGMLYVADVGATGMEFEVNKVELKDEDDKKTYIAKYDYIIDDEEDLKESLEAEFEIDNNDGRCVIASFEEK